MECGKTSPVPQVSPALKYFIPTYNWFCMSETFSLRNKFWIYRVIKCNLRSLGWNYCCHNVPLQATLLHPPVVQHSNLWQNPWYHWVGTYNFITHVHLCLAGVLLLSPSCHVCVHCLKSRPNAVRVFIRETRLSVSRGWRRLQWNLYSKSSNAISHQVRTLSCKSETSTLCFTDQGTAFDSPYI